jgi:membrane-associated phospholipid phosphatase
MPDPILLWNEVALEANRVSHTNGQGEQPGPTLSSRALAIVHLAMYDAYAGVDTAAGLKPYLPSPASPAPGTLVDAAVAAAAHRTLSKLFPSQTPFFDSILDSVGTKTNTSHDFGVAVADAILADRAGDPGAGGSYTPLPQRGKHRPDPDNPGQGFHAPLYGAQSNGFGITERFELAPPPFDDDEYKDALRQVRGRGIAPELMGTLPHHIKGRTVDQTLIGIFWAYDGVLGLGTPPRLYNQIIRKVAINKPNPATGAPNTPAQNARLFALVNVAMADAGILAWDQKYLHNFWRPVVGIREHDTSMGPAPTQAHNNISNDCDPLWLPLGAPNTNRLGAKNFTPPFPAYPSGHATFGAAAFHITRLFYEVPLGDRHPDHLLDGLDFVSDECNGINTDNRGTVRPRHLRNFPDGLWQMIEENGRSRVYLGVHWIFDAFAVTEDHTPDLARQRDGKFIGGVPLGLQIAEDIFQFGDQKAPKKSTVGPRP